MKCAPRRQDAAAGSVNVQNVRALRGNVRSRSTVQEYKRQERCACTQNRNASYGKRKGENQVWEWKTDRLLTYAGNRCTILLQNH